MTSTDFYDEGVRLNGRITGMRNVHHSKAKRRRFKAHMNHIVNAYNEEGPSRTVILPHFINPFITRRKSEDTNALPVRDAPDDDFYQLASKDYRRLMHSENLAVTVAVKHLLMLHSIRGHAAAGHAEFRNTARYPNTTLHDVCDALMLDAKKIQQEHLDCLNRIVDCIEDVLKDPKKPFVLHDDKNNPLTGAHIMSGYVVSQPLAFLRGYVAHGYVDNIDMRLKTGAERNMNIGGGETCAVHLPTMMRYGLTLDDLGRIPIDENKKKEYIKKGIIIDEDYVDATHDIAHGYIRRQKGYGVSDDQGMIAAGFLFGGKDSAMGSQVADAIDTLEKFLPFVSRKGEDETIAEMILNNCKRRGIDLISEQQLKDFIYLSAIDIDKYTIPDSSQRRFHRRNHPNAPTAAELHLRLVNGEDADNFPEIELGFMRVPSGDFYRAWNEKWTAFVDAQQTRSVVSLACAVNGWPSVPKYLLYNCGN